MVATKPSDHADDRSYPRQMADEVMESVLDRLLDATARIETAP
jgi:hypothetical protein